MKVFDGYLIEHVLIPTGESISLVCPVCSEEGTSAHINSVVVNAGGNITKILPNGRVEHSHGEADGRGASVTLYCFCEAGDPSAIKLQFNKGSLILSSEKVRAEELCDKDTSLPVDSWADLWRD